MLWIGLEDILLVGILNNNGESAIISSRRYKRLFLHLGLIFTSDREDFISKMYIFLSPVRFGPCGIGAE